MAKINIFNGSRKPLQDYLHAALAELAKFQTVEVSPKRGQIDTTGYRLVQELEKSSMARGRNQVNIDLIASKLLQKPEIYRRPNTQKIVLLERDVFSPGLNWCYGQYRKLGKHGQMDAIILSTARITNKLHFYDLLTHELGHMYGAAPRGRSNTVEDLGSHCINDLCVMQQKLTVQESLEYSQRRHQKKAATYCGQCQDDLRS